VEIDHCLRKEVDVNCLTPSNLIAIPSGTSVDIAVLMQQFKGSHWSQLLTSELTSVQAVLDKIKKKELTIHNFPHLSSKTEHWLKLQMASSTLEIKKLLSERVS
jgi:DNA polymerase gamma 1